MPDPGSEQDRPGAAGSLVGIPETMAFLLGDKHWFFSGFFLSLIYYVRSPVIAIYRGGSTGLFLSFFSSFFPSFFF